MMYAIAVALLAGVLGAGDWLGFRGTNGTGIGDSAALPTEFSGAKNLAWKTGVPFGRSSPVVTRDRVFLTASEGDALITLALDRQTGKLLWRREVPRARRMDIYKGNDPASPSPASDGSNVYVFFAESGLISYTRDGKERWRIPLGPFRSFYGMAGSPVVADDTLVLVCDHDGESFIMAVDTHTGRVRWKKTRVAASAAFATPAIHRPAGGKPQVIVAGSGRVDAYALQTGELIWWTTDAGAYPIGVPAIAGGMVYLTGAGGTESSLEPFDDFLKKFDADHDGILRRGELTGGFAGHFGWLDLNRDDRIERGEYDKVRSVANSPKFGLAALKLGAAAGDVTATQTAWRVQKQYPFVTSPLLYDGVLYTVKNGGIVMSLDPATGTVLKTGRLDGALEPYFASPVAADGKVFMVSEQGKVTVLRAGAQWERLALNDLDEECWATPAIAGGRMFIRTRGAVYSFGARSATD